MNRQDLSLVLGQVDNIGTTLLQNRMMKQRDTERAADNTRQQSQFDAQMGLRRDEMDAQNKFRTEQATQNNAWRTQNEDQQQLQTIIKANADGSLDDASREKANQWISAHPQLSATGIQLIKPAPKLAGTMETSQTRNAAELRKLQQQVASALTPEAKAQAEQDLADFKGLLPGRGNAEPEQDMETVTEVYPRQEADNTEEITETPGAKRTGIMGIDALAKDGPPIRSTNTISKPFVPEKRVSYKRPRGTAGQPAGSQPTQSVDKELQLAQEALRQGADPAKVAAKFKARTGKDLPQ